MLLLRMGEAQAARRLVQSLGHSRATERLLSATMRVFLANADPAGLCPFVSAGIRLGEKERWRLVGALCSALAGDPGPAGWTIERVRNSKKIATFDILLAERILGASYNGRRSVSIQWERIDQLTDWRFGFATAVAVPIPLALRARAPDYMRGWTVLAPMSAMADRLAAAGAAASDGILSGDAYRGLIVAALLTDAQDSVQATRQGGAQNDAAELLAARLRTAFSAETSTQRLAAMARLWSAASNDEERYAAMVLTARAAAGLTVAVDVGDRAYLILGSMLAGGFDRNAAAWRSKVAPGSRAWGVLAVSLERPLSDVDADTVLIFAKEDDSRNFHRSKLLLASLAGLERINTADALIVAQTLGVDLTKQSRWSRALDRAARRGEAGTVALLVALGMQSRDWSALPAYHLYHMTGALRRVGLMAEARMIAAEALVRS